MSLIDPVQPVDRSRPRVLLDCVVGDGVLRASAAGTLEVINRVKRRANSTIFRRETHLCVSRLPFSAASWATRHRAAAMVSWEARCSARGRDRGRRSGRCRAGRGRRRRRGGGARRPRGSPPGTGRCGGGPRCDATCSCRRCAGCAADRPRPRVLLDCGVDDWSIPSKGIT
jgi:hypothetical protein